MAERVGFEPTVPFVHKLSSVRIQPLGHLSEGAQDSSGVWARHTGSVRTRSLAFARVVGEERATRGRPLRSRVHVGRMPPQSVALQRLSCRRGGAMGINMGRRNLFQRLLRRRGLSLSILVASLRRRYLFHKLFVSATDRRPGNTQGLISLATGGTVDARCGAAMLDGASRTAQSRDVEPRIEGTKQTLAGRRKIEFGGPRARRPHRAARSIREHVSQRHRGCCRASSLYLSNVAARRSRQSCSAASPVRRARL